MARARAENQEHNERSRASINRDVTLSSKRKSPAGVQPSMGGDLSSMHSFPRKVMVSINRKPMSKRSDDDQVDVEGKDSQTVSSNTVSKASPPLESKGDVEERKNKLVCLDKTVDSEQGLSALLGEYGSESDDSRDGSDDDPVSTSEAIGKGQRAIEEKCTETNCGEVLK